MASNDNTDLPADKPRTIILPPVPYALAIGGGWWLDRHELAIPLDPGYPATPLAVIFITMGLGLLIWTIWELHQHHTTVNPYAAAKHLCVSGPFRFSRNPIYLGDWLILLGFSVWFETLWPLLLSPVVWAILHFAVIRHEEDHLEAKFGDAYREYRSNVRRWL